MATTTRTVLDRPATTPTRQPRQQVPAPVRTPTRRPRHRLAATVVAAAVVAGVGTGAFLLMAGERSASAETAPMGLSQQAWQQYRSGERGAVTIDAWQQYRSGERAG